MPSGTRIADNEKRSIVNDYYSSPLSVDQICSRYGISRRALYSWIEKGNGAGRRYNARKHARGIHLTKDETELLLLLMLIGEKSLTVDQLAIMNPLQERLLNIADELTELERI